MFMAQNSPSRRPGVNHFALLSCCATDGSCVAVMAILDVRCVVSTSQVSHLEPTFNSTLRSHVYACVHY